MIRVLAEPFPQGVGRCMFRITDQLKKYAPEGVEFVTNPSQSHDLQILQAWCPDCKHFLTGKPYALMAHEYVPEMLSDAILVASWIPDLMDGDRFLPLPLGADPETFRPLDAEIRFKGLSTGYVASTEFVHEFARAATASGGMIAHLGGDVGLAGLGISHQHFENISDERLNQLYNEVGFISALRTRCGFEMPGVEGLMAGTRCVVFDRPDQSWFRKWAVTVHEGSPAFVEEQLREVLSKPPIPVSAEERAEVVSALSWEPICKKFWTALMERM